jgi:hypothetical protein
VLRHRPVLVKRRRSATSAHTLLQPSDKADVSLTIVTVADGGLCLNQNGLKSWYSVADLAASYWRGIWRNRGDELPSSSAGGSSGGAARGRAQTSEVRGHRGQFGDPQFRRYPPETCNDCYRNPIDNHGIAAMINSEITSAPM